jgi:hypothetical protein
VWLVSGMDWVPGHNAGCPQPGSQIAAGERSEQVACGQGQEKAGTTQ